MPTAVAVAHRSVVGKKDERSTSGTRRRVRLDAIDREHLRDAIIDAITAAEGDLHLAAAVLRMPLAALEEIVEDDPTLHKARRKA